MKKALLFIFAIFSFGLYGQEVSVMTFNIRYDNPNDGEDQWSERRAEVVELIKTYNPSVFGLQEAVKHQVDYVDSSMVNFAFVGVGRDDGKTKGEYSPVFYDSTLYQMIDSGTFWLSSTPDTVSVGWDASMERICTFVLLKHVESEKLFWVFNSHFDHIGEIARVSSAALIVQKHGQLNISEAPAVLMGDFNAPPESRPMKLFTNHFLNSSIAETSAGLMGTFWGFEPGTVAEERIDHILGKYLTFESGKVIDDKRSNGRHISDHLPVLAVFKLN